MAEIPYEYFIDIVTKRYFDGVDKQNLQQVLDCFHEDAVQAGFAVAEQLGGLARPWQLDNPSPRIVVPSTQLASYHVSNEAAA